MKRVSLLLIFVLALSFAHAQADMSRELRTKVFGAERSSDPITVWLLFSDQIDYQKLDLELRNNNASPIERRNRVLREAYALHTRSIEWLKAEMGSEVIVESYWLGNSVLLELYPEDVQALLKKTQVAWMEGAYEKQILHEEFEFVKRTSTTEAVNGPEPGLRAIKAPALWAMGYTGKGRKALIMDTGVWDKHPSLSQKWLGNRYPLSQVWYGFDSPVPKDKGSGHGTHVGGTVLGLDPANNDTVGVAFNAQFMASDPVASGNASERKGLYNIIRAFQWALDPDGDTNTIEDMPDVVNNSWGHRIDTSENICTNPFGDALEACQLAGIALVWSAGNNGPGGQTIGAPATITRNPYLVFTVGAVNANTAGYPIANFSSRGPTYCLNGFDSIKPEVVAPGVSVRSSIDSSGYAFNQGTSMASPHVSGSVLLLKEAFPALPGQDLLEALYLTATDLGPVGEENTYGNGFINVDSAYQYLASKHTPTSPKTYAEDIEIQLVKWDHDWGCMDSNMAHLIVVNHGSRTVNRADLKIVVEAYGGPSQTLVPSSDLLSGDSLKLDVKIPANALNLSGMQAKLALQPAFDDDPTNNSAAGHWQNIQWTSGPYVDDFTKRTERWTMVNPNRDQTWNNRFWNKDGLKFEALQLEFYAMTARVKQRDYAYMPAVDVSQMDSLYFEFEYAYASKVSSLFADTLRIWASTECNGQWDLLWEKGGTELATRADTTGLFIPQPNEWKTERIDLSSYDDAQTMYIRLEGKNEYGNNLYINQVELNGKLLSGVQNPAENNTFIIYPNPVESMLTVEGFTGQFQILDLSGRVIKTGHTSSSDIDVQSITPGTYLLRLSDNSAQRFIKM